MSTINRNIFNEVWYLIKDSPLHLYPLIKWVGIKEINSFVGKLIYQINTVQSIFSLALACMILEEL